jgi:hypothetical protein
VDSRQSYKANRYICSLQHVCLSRKKRRKSGFCGPSKDLHRILIFGIGFDELFFETQRCTVSIYIVDQISRQQTLTKNDNNS